LILTGLKSHLHTPGIVEIMAALESEHYTVYTQRIEKEPTVDVIDGIVRQFDNVELQSVVAIGGGSVLDAGKAVSAMLPLNAPVMNYLEGVGQLGHPGIKKFFVAIPTTAGTGSECTANAVISGTGPAGGFKRSLRHENLVPDAAIVDPSLTYHCPPDITAASGMDAFTQLIESYLSLKANPYTDALALDGIRYAHRFLPTAGDLGEDVDARSGMAYAAMLSGMTLANAGLGLTHGFASSIAASFEIPHGIACATMMWIVNSYNIKELLHNHLSTAAAEKYANLGKIFTAVEGKTDDWYMRYAGDYLGSLTHKLNIPHLGTFGVTPADLEKIAAVTDHKSNPVRFEKEQLVEMLQARI
jgi:alcohol dehydrogenase class IV